MSSNARFNPEHDGTFNEVPLPNYQDLTVDQRQAALDRFDELASDTHNELKD